MAGMLTATIREVQLCFVRHGFFRTVGRAALAPFYLIRDRLLSRRILFEESEDDLDREFGVDTKGRIRLSSLDIDSPNWLYCNGYRGAPRRAFSKALAAIQINYPDFTFIDFGSGKGRALLLASEFPFNSIIGVEFSPELNVIARQNISAFRSPNQKCTDLKSICADFASFALPDTKLVLYLYNPCQEPVMAKVLQNIGTSLEAHSRDLYIIYFTPKFRHLFDAATFLKKISEEDDRPDRDYCVFRNLAEK